MYISKEQVELANIDIEFRKKVREAKNYVKSTSEGISDCKKLEYMEELEKVKNPKYKSKRLKIENGMILKGSATNETVFIPEGVTEIGKEAFESCNNSKFIFPNGLKKIGDSAFEDCHNVFEMDVKDADLCYPADAVVLVRAGDEIDQFSKGFSQFPSTLEEIGDYAFRRFGINAYGYNKKLMEYLILPQSLRKIGKGAFTNCGIEAVYIAGPEIISKNCFSNNWGLKKVVFGDDVKTIGDVAFDACRFLEKIIFSKNLKEIGNCAFSGCTSIKKITLPNILEKIGKYAFCECSSLTSIIIPNNVSEIGKYAFFKCSSLRKVKLGEGIINIPEECFADCNKLTEIEIPDNVVKIENNAFKNCNKLKIRATTGSFAEKYAKENNIKFEMI